MQTLSQDVRYGLRVLGKNPGFATIAILTLALGIGANTGIFSVLRQILLQRLPVPHPKELVLLYGPGEHTGHTSSDEGDGSESFSYPMYTDLRDQNSVFAGLAAKADFPVSVAFHGQTERADAELVSGNYFQALEVQPAAGRLLLPGDTTVIGSNPVVVLGYGYWQKRFGGTRDILNQSVLINDRLMTIVGIVQHGFDGIQLGMVADLYIPVTMKPVITPAWNGLNDHTDYWLKLIGRLKPGMSSTQAAAALAPTYHALLENELAFNTGLNEQSKRAFVSRQIVLRNGARGRPILENDTREQLLTLMGMVGLVLLITCGNVAGLLIARGASRKKEIGVRLSLGASRWRLIRQLVVESCLLSIGGAALGLLFANWMSNSLVHFASENDIATGLRGPVNFPVLLFTAALAIFCGLIFGVAPALSATRIHLAETLKDQAGALSGARSQSRLRKALVVSQVTLTLVLVISACGFIRSLYNLEHIDLGLRPEHVLQFSIAPQLNGYDQPRSLGLYSRLEDRIAALPGVQSLSGVEQPLISDSDRGSNVTVEGEPPELAGTRHVMWNAIGPGHFANLHIALLQGREFARQDGAESPKVAIINETMAKEFFPSGQALGKRMKFGGGSGDLNMEIVGIVRDSHHSDLQELTKSFLYVPYAQMSSARSLTYYVRTSQDPGVIASAVRSAVRELDSSLPVYDVRSFEDQINRRLSPNRLVAFLALAFGLLAGLLAAMGIYGLLAYSVAQRTRELGVRMALGAEPKQVGMMVLNDVARLIALGALVGLPLAYASSKLINSMLYGVQAFGSLSVAIALFVLVMVAGIAAYVPTNRATRIEPMKALRYE